MIAHCQKANEDKRGVVSVVNYMSQTFDIRFGTIEESKVSPNKIREPTNLDPRVTVLENGVRVFELIRALYAMNNPPVIFQSLTNDSKYSLQTFMFYASSSTVVFMCI